MQGFLKLLKQTTLHDTVVPQKKVIIIKSTDTPIQGFETLLRNRILSAPVLDTASHKFIGFLDLRDLISYTVFAYQNRDTIAYEKPFGPFYHTLVDNVTVTYLARRNPFHPVNEKATLYDVAQVLATGVHRVPVVDCEGNLIAIASQSSLIAFFNKHLEEGLKDETIIRLRDIELGTSPVISVSKDTLTIETFKKLDDHKISGIPILDFEGRLVGNISGKDLKLFIESHSSLDCLNLPTLQFLGQIRSDDTIDIRAPTISCNLDDTLGMVIRKLAATKVHRLYIVNSSEDYSPVRVVSLTDTLRYILRGTTPRNFD